MKNTIKLLGITALIAIIGLSVVSCLSTGGVTSGGTEADEDITVTITGDFSEYAGWEAWIAVGDDAFALPLRVGAGTSSLPFTILRMDNNKPFNKAGTYMIIFWFRQNDDKSTDADYVIMSRRISEGNNSIEFSSFSPL